MSIISYFNVKITNLCEQPKITLHSFHLKIFFVNGSNEILTSCQKIIEFFADLEEEILPLNGLNSSEISNFDSRLHSYQKELTKNTQNVLKTEWERVKKGI